jgi:hypothetical protein
MDKILHHRIYDSSVLHAQQLKVVVIVRDPADALPSILSLNSNSIQTPKEALNYYVQTIQRVSKELRFFGRPFLLLRYSDLVKDTEDELKRITDYLDLEAPLTPEYEQMWSTGTPTVGDPSSKIELGRVSRSTSSYQIEMERELIERARQSYRAFLEDCNDLLKR